MEEMCVITIDFLAKLENLASQDNLRVNIEVCAHYKTTLMILIKLRPNHSDSRE